VEVLSLVIVFIAAYLIGSVPTGYIVVKIAKNEDIRKLGSGSTGATNVKRVMGKTWFFIVMLLDALKGALSVVLAAVFVGTGLYFGLAPVLAAIAVILGHSKSVFLKFSGGKSVASGVGTIIALSWQAGLLVAVVWAVTTYASKYVSVGSIIALSLSPFLMWYFDKPPAYILYCVVGAVYIIYLHRENVVRLVKGTENKVRG